MNPQPIPTSTQTNPAAAPSQQPLVEFIRTQRQTAAYILLALSVVCLVAAVWLMARGFRTPETKAEDKPAAANPLDPEKPEAAPVEISDPKRGEYRIGGFGASVGFLATAIAGIWLLMGIPNPSVERQRTDARVALLSVGGLLGATLILLGGVYFYLWSDSLAGWLDRGEAKEMRWVVIPLLMVVVGAGLIFAAVQPARAEERNNTTLRRLVYGSNLLLTILLLFVVLVVANVAFAMRVPNRLDTTATGFYSLSQPTEAVLAQLDQPVTAYAILQDSGDRYVEDIRRMLQSCEDAGGGKFKVKYISPQLNKADLAALRARYSQLEVNDIGVLLVVGEDAQQSGPPGRYTFIRADEFLDREAGGGRQAQPAFAGEAKLIRELMFLADNRQKPVITFTQSAGELDVSGSDDRNSASLLKAFLEKNYLEVKSHAFDPINPKVPDETDVLVVASPRTTIPPAVADAIKKYMAEPRPGGKKGRLIVLAGNPEPRTALKPSPTGLESLLSEFNVTIGNKYMIGVYSGQIEPAEIPAAFTDEAVKGKNSIAQTLRRYAMNFVLPREVTAAGAELPGAPGGNPAYKTTRLLETITNHIWLEDEWPTSLNQAVAEARRDHVRKQVTRTKSVGVLVSETAGNQARVAVYGSGYIASDEWARATRGTSPVEFDLIGVTIDWLRDRPPVPSGITSKQYTTYTFPPKVDTTRLLYFPLGLAFLTVTGIGVGVWVIRRK